MSAGLTSGLGQLREMADAGWITEDERKRLASGHLMEGGGRPDPMLTLGALEYRTRDLRRALGDDARPDIAEALAELERAVEAVVEAVRR